MKLNLSDPMNQFASAPKRKIVRLNETKEVDVHTMICKYIKLAYPQAMFMSDFGAGLRMGMGAAQRQRIQKSNHKYPDLIIFQPRALYCGLMIEIKKDDKQLYKADGVTFKNEHVSEQDLAHELLRQRGWFVCFGQGFDACKKIVDDYFSL